MVNEPDDMPEGDDTERASSPPEPPTEKDKKVDEMPAPAPPHEVSVFSLRVLAGVRWLILLAVASVALGSVITFWGPSLTGSGGGHAHEGEQKGAYYCPMHPQIRGEKGGECPICHMTLEPIPADRLDGAGTEAGGELASAEGKTPDGVVPVTVTSAAQSTVGIATSVVTEASLGDRLRVPAVIQAPESNVAEVRVRAAGFVEQVAVSQTGVKVSRGQPLAYIYSPEIYRAQEELLAASKWTDTALPGLFATGASGASGASGAGGSSGASSTPPGRDESKTASLVEASRRALELLGLSRGDIDEVLRTGKPQRAIAVRAPRSGYVTQFRAVLGSRATPETALYEIADLSTVWIVASVNERDLAAIKVGTEARFLATGAGAGTKSPTFTGKLALIEPIVDPVTRTTRVRLVVPNRTTSAPKGTAGQDKKDSGIGMLRPGEYGEVELDLPASPSLLVPSEAVIRTGEHAYVFVVTGPERFEPREVKPGLTKEGNISIAAGDGVHAGDRVVSRGGFLLDAESRLKASLLGRASSSPPSAATPSSSAAPSSSGAPR